MKKPHTTLTRRQQKAAAPKRCASCGCTSPTCDPATCLYFMCDCHCPKADWDEV